ncbi:hypothetical protein D6825_02965 [Candidatus Woesearchaeota archaeon]|nr:MAG: hypothetical protein D6825_02965 [Candidatus Woesearchaeota archaeon]
MVRGVKVAISIAFAAALSGCPSIRESYDRRSPQDESWKLNYQPYDNPRYDRYEIVPPKFR